MAPRRSLTLVTVPAAEPVTLSEAKGWARVDGNDEDTLIAQLIGAATNAAEEYLRRALISQTLKLTIDLERSGLYDCLSDGVYDLPVTALYGGLPRAIDLPKGPVQSVASVVTYDTANTSSTFASSNYLVDTGGARIVLNEGCIWPSNMRPLAACEISYVAGYGATPSAVPQPIKTGIMIHVASLYEQRGQCEDAMDIPPGSKQLYNQYRVIGRR